MDVTLHNSDTDNKSQTFSNTNIVKLWSTPGPFQSHSKIINFKSKLDQGWWPHDFSVSPSPLATNLGFELDWTRLELGLGGLGKKGLGPGHNCVSKLDPFGWINLSGKV